MFPFLLVLTRIVSLVLTSKFGCSIHIISQPFAQLLQDLIQPYITSLTSMKAEQTIETAKDSSGARVIEAFLASNAATKQKRKLINKYALLLYVIWLFDYFMNDRFHSVALFI